MIMITHLNSTQVAEIHTMWPITRFTDAKLGNKNVVSCNTGRLIEVDSSHQQDTCSNEHGVCPMPRTIAQYEFRR